PTEAATGTPRRSQRGMEAPLQSRHYLDARQVGISVVRGVGPRFPHGAVLESRSVFRQEAARALSSRMVHAPEWPARGLRVCLWRREPPGPRLGGVARLQD